MHSVHCGASIVSACVCDQFRFVNNKYDELKACAGHGGLGMRLVMVLAVVYCLYTKCRGRELCTNTLTVLTFCSKRFFTHNYQMK